MIATLPPSLTTVLYMPDTAIATRSSRGRRCDARRNREHQRSLPVDRLLDAFVLKHGGGDCFLRVRFATCTTYRRPDLVFIAKSKARSRGAPQV